jgi:hypothetical protein
MRLMNRTEREFAMGPEALKEWLDARKAMRAMLAKLLRQIRAGVRI